MLQPVLQELVEVDRAALVLVDLGEADPDLVARDVRPEAAQELSELVDLNLPGLICVTAVEELVQLFAFFIVDFPRQFSTPRRTTGAARAVLHKPPSIE